MQLGLDLQEELVVLLKGEDVHPQNTAKVVEIIQKFETVRLFVRIRAGGARDHFLGTLVVLEIFLVHRLVRTHGNHRNLFYVTYLKRFVHFACATRRKVQFVELQLFKLLFELDAQLKIKEPKNVKTLVLKGLNMYSKRRSIFLIFFMKKL